MSTGIRISVVSRDGAADPASTAALRRRLAESTPDTPGKEMWGEARTVPRPGGPATQGGVPDIVLDFLTGQLVPELIKETVKSAATYLVWTVVSHLRSQPDATQKVVLAHSDAASEVRIEICAKGLDDDEIARARAAMEQILQSAIERQRREGPSGDED